MPDGDNAQPAAPVVNVLGSTLLEKCWALAGLISGGILIWMALDLLRGQRIPGADSDRPDSP